MAKLKKGLEFATLKLRDPATGDVIEGAEFDFWSNRSKVVQKKLAKIRLQEEQEKAELVKTASEKTEDEAAEELTKAHQKTVLGLVWARLKEVRGIELDDGELKDPTAEQLIAVDDGPYFWVTGQMAGFVLEGKNFFQRHEVTTPPQPTPPSQTDILPDPSPQMMLPG